MTADPLRALVEKWREEATEVRAIGARISFPQPMIREAEKIERYADELAAALSQAGEVPDGWVLVPKEPTQAMWAAFRNNDGGAITFHQGYRAMLAAAPAAQGVVPEVAQGPVDREQLANWIHRKLTDLAVEYRKNDRLGEDLRMIVGGMIPVYYAPPVAAAPAVVIDEAWCATDQEISEWLERHDLAHALPGSDARAAFEDARSAHMLAALGQEVVR